jgi:hypothetical protein
MGEKGVKLVAVDAEEHARFRVRTLPAEIPHFVEIMVGEFAAAAAVCPIFLTKNVETGAFYAGALFGFKPGENLLAGVGDGPQPFVPLERQRAGFYVSGEHVAIDLDDPRFSSGQEGEPLFEDGGQPGMVLRRIQRLLTLLVEGKRETDGLIARLLALKLVEPIDVSLQFDDGEKLVLQGLYTVSLDALQELDDAEVIELFRKGYLQSIYTLAGSLKQVGVLAQRRNRMLAGSL